MAADGAGRPFGAGEIALKFTSLLIASMLGAVVPVAAYAQSGGATVKFTASATMPTLEDPAAKDTFVVTVTDAQVSTQFELTCTAGHTTLLIMRQDKACGVAGNGSIVNPNTKELLPRTQYAGGYVVKSDGKTDANGISVNYLALGQVAASGGQFSGDMKLKPEVTSSGAAALRDVVLQNINGNSGGSVIDERVDTVDLDGLFIPGAGLPSDPGCTWNGNMVFAYQTESWFLDLKAKCGDAEYAFKGNMPWTDSPGAENQTQYVLTLTLPSAAAASDDALFASGDPNISLFVTADGVNAQIIMKESSYVTIDIDGVPTETPSKVEAQGSFTGTNVPVETVRSLGTLFALLSSNLFGA